MKSPFFSITTPCFNSEKTIERTIKSILEQEFKDYEYIIVDGGSTDGTIDILKKYEPLFEGRMHWKSERDNGLYDAFNKGVERSIGTYCWNVNSDDWIEHDALLNIWNFLQSQKYDDWPILVGGLNYVNENYKIIKKSIFSKERIHAIYKMDAMIAHPSTLVPKHVYENYGAFDTQFKVAGDLDWFQRTYALGVQFETLDCVVSNMGIGGISYQLNYRLDKKERWIILCRKYKNVFVRLFHFFLWNFRYVKKHYL